VAHQVIAERRKTPNWREVKDLLTLLMKSQDSETGEGLSDDQIAIELEVFISAGHETTAHCTFHTLPFLHVMPFNMYHLCCGRTQALAWVLYHLANNQRVLGELRQEVDTVLCPLAQGRAGQALTKCGHR
jgi:cytochrome P450